MSMLNSQADNTPISPAIMQRAAEWMARLWSDDASEADAIACADWRAAHPEHERAWDRLQRFTQQFDTIPNVVVRGALSKPPRPGGADRRRALQLLGLVIAGGGSAFLLHESNMWKRSTADYSTALGEVRAVLLADGTHVVLDTASAIDVRYNDHERRIILRTGAILVTSAPDTAAIHRPLLVQTEQGTATALGTRFSVRAGDGVSKVAVFQGLVELWPAQANMAGVRLRAGQRGSYGMHAVHEVAAVDDSAAAWTQGRLVVERMRLADLVAEFSRYRHGLLRCDEDVANLRVTGVYSLHDIDRSLENLALSLPVQVRYRTRFWVTVGARQPA
ncbi:MULTISPECIES: FecR domain-containing protein [unclassified Janthinobacterium]|uniref:FecR domain-containing protein n=1 Tax=unclassified Janthinobacterium TaxID=2610881 RepID=UPI001609D785|nr:MULTISPECIES: FecR family protein [unclassified Janthinobacterium]MBB5368420.1 transmembrane sensor [Janthinobacterium sp. K2C7]MBB5382044.1 transmembrane sensor [Janthinobacterium sp. K2Li3]MBB5386802.1 transmembrane sensor [Janthinobacterium sp. K2E3]